MSALICELSSRSGDGVDVALLWQRCDNTAFVAVFDHRTGEKFVLDVQENDNALDIFHHPYAYAAHRRIEHLHDLRIAEIAHLRRWRTQIPDSVAVQVRDGRVILHGQAESTAQRDAAESAVRQLTGVRAVGNLIEVKSEAGPPPRGRQRQPITSIGRVGFTRPERSSS